MGLPHANPWREGTRFLTHTMLLMMFLSQTLPSRGAVAIWQVFTTVMAAGVAMTVIVCGYTLTNYVPTLNSLLMGVGIVEACRLALAAMLLRVHQSENLATL